MNKEELRSQLDYYHAVEKIADVARHQFVDEEKGDHGYQPKRNYC